MEPTSKHAFMLSYEWASEEELRRLLRVRTQSNPVTAAETVTFKLWRCAKPQGLLAWTTELRSYPAPFDADCLGLTALPDLVVSPKPQLQLVPTGESLGNREES